MKILFFSPFNAIWVSAFPEALIANSLKKLGNEVIYVTCGGQFDDFCVSMRAHGLSQDSIRQQKRSVCATCSRHKNLLRKKFNFQSYDLDTKLGELDRKKITTLLSEVNRSNFLDFEVDGVSIGRFALYEIVLQHKKSNLDLNDREWARYKIAMKNCLASHLAAKNILDQEKPDVVVTYNSLYGVNAVFCRQAELRDIPRYTLLAGPNLKRRLEGLIVTKNNAVEYLAGLRELWTEAKNRPSEKKFLHSATDHLLEVFKGANPFAYSAPKGKGRPGIRERFGIKDNQKILLAILSSYDEIFADGIFLNKAQEHDVFSDQVAWCKALMDYVKDRPDLHLVIRVHPREFPNKREGVKSDHATRLEKELSQLPLNVVVNWPADNISLYDIAEEADVTLVAWSSVGKEMTLLGIPVVTHETKLMTPPLDLFYSATTREAYFREIERALVDGWSFERARLSYRWNVLEGARGVIDISGSFKQPSEAVKKTLVSRVVRKILRVMIPDFWQRRDLARAQKILSSAADIQKLLLSGAPTLAHLNSESSQGPCSLDEESRSLVRELKRLSEEMFKGRNSHNETKLQKDMNRFFKSQTFNKDI